MKKINYFILSGFALVSCKKDLPPPVIENGMEKSMKIILLNKDNDEALLEVYPESITLPRPLIIKVNERKTGKLVYFKEVTNSITEISNLKCNELEVEIIKQNEVISWKKDVALNNQNEIELTY